MTPLQKPSPRGDTGNEPVFRLRFLKEAKPRFFRERSHDASNLDTACLPLFYSTAMLCLTSAYTRFRADSLELRQSVDVARLRSTAFATKR